MSTGRELKTIQNIECYSKGGQMLRRVGYVTIYEDGIVFYKVKGAVMAQAGFGLLGAAVAGNSRNGEANLELQYSEISSVSVRNKMLSPAIEITLKNGQEPVYFISQSRLFNGKSDLEEAANIIRQRI